MRDALSSLGGSVPLRNDCLETTVKGVYVAGDVTGIEEASAAMVEGHLAGLEAAASLGFKSDNYDAERKDCMDQLAALRSGPTAEKIRSGLACAESR